MITVNGKPHPWRKGLTVKELLEELGEKIPALVKINGEYVPGYKFDTTEIPDNSEISLIYVIAGG